MLEQGIQAPSPAPDLIPAGTSTENLHRDWNYERGHISPINAHMLSNYISNLQDPIYYVAGPPGMVAGTQQTLVELAVPEEDIRTENFAGY